MAADATIPLGDICPVDVLSQTEKYASSALVCALGQHDLLTFAEYGTDSCSTDHVRVTFLREFFRAPCLWPKLRPVQQPRFFKLALRGFFLTR